MNWKIYAFQQIPSWPIFVSDPNKIDNADFHYPAACYYKLLKTKMWLDQKNLILTFIITFDLVQTKFNDRQL